MNSLDGKVALISGAARGIGAETARCMVAAGARVVIGDVLLHEGQATADALGEAAVFTPLDVTDPAQWDAAIALATARFGGLDILVNNAGLFLGRDFEEVTLEEWQKLAAVNLTGVWLGTKQGCRPSRRAAWTAPRAAPSSTSLRSPGSSAPILTRSTR